MVSNNYWESWNVHPDRSRGLPVHRQDLEKLRGKITTAGKYWKATQDDKPQEVWVMIMGHALSLCKTVPPRLEGGELNRKSVLSDNGKNRIYSSL